VEVKRKIMINRIGSSLKKIIFSEIMAPPGE
jgi:hypothetical protein